MLCVFGMNGNTGAMDEDIQPVSLPPKFDLDLLSVEDLKARIEDLRQEIAACEAAISRKGNAKSAADAMFNFGTDKN